MAANLDPAKISKPLAVAYSLWCRTLRYEHFGLGKVSDLVNQGDLVVATLWHNELFALPGFSLRHPFKVVGIVSQSKDGAFLANALEHLGVRTARGSSSRGGVKALVAARKYMRNEKRVACITVDGPRGPRHKAKSGALYLAQKTGAWIVPVRVITPKAFVFEKAWDKFRLPYPFSKCEIRIGEPYRLPEENLTREVLENEKRRLEKTLGALGPS